MKLCHFSDSHLGAGESHPRRGKSGLTLRQEDIINAFTEAVDKIIEIKPDLCIHAGDIFDSVRPLNRIMAIAGEQLYRLAEENGIPTVLISGNHDAPKQPHIGSAIEVYKQIDNLHVVSASKLEKIGIGDTRVFALPHCLTTEKLKEELAKCTPDPNARFNILVMHGVAAGMPEFSMADLGEQELPVDLMDRFDYTALGHFHNYCQVGNRAWYAGSTERLSQAERSTAKGFLEIDLDPLTVKFHQVHTRPMVDIQTINASGKRGDELAGLIQQSLEKIDSSDKIVRVKIKDVTEETIKTLPVDVLNTLRQKSFALDISFEREKSAEAERAIGRSAIGKIDTGFVEFLDTVDLKGFDKERLKAEALKYLSQES